MRVDGCMAAGRQAIVSEILALGPSRRSDLKIVKRRTHLGGSLRTDRDRYFEGLKASMVGNLRSGVCRVRGLYGSESVVFRSLKSGVRRIRGV